MTGFPIRSAATLISAGLVAGIAVRSDPGLGVFLGCCAVTLATVGLGFLSEALRDREGPQCLSEACLGVCQSRFGSDGLSSLHGGQPP